MKQTVGEPRTRARYLRQECVLTLAEGLAEYYAVNEGIVMRPPDLPDESAKLFRSHDMCHVIFGLSTTLDDEAMADARTMLSCDVGVARYTNYLRTDAQAKALFAEIGIWNSVWVTLRVLPRIGRAVIEAFRMPKRWPWEPPDHYLGRTVESLRRQYGIRVI